MKRTRRPAPTVYTGPALRLPDPIAPPVGPLDFLTGHSPRATAHTRAMIQAAHDGRSLGVSLGLVGACAAHEAGDLADLDLAFIAVLVRF